MSDDTIKEVEVRINKGLADLPSTVSELFGDGAYTTLEDLDEHQDYPLKVLKKEKLWYLQSVLKRRNETSINRYIMSIANFRGRPFFIGDQNDREIIESSWLVESVLLTSFFTVELFRKYANERLRDQDDPIFNVAENLHLLRHFLISSKTQFPFYLLVEFFNLTKIEGEAPDNFVDLALHFFENMVGHTLKPLPPCDQISINGIKHLLDLMHYSLCPPFAERDIPRTTRTEIEREFINYASELEEFGVEFKMIKGVDVSLLDITFKNGKMKIPSLKFARSTIALFKTLIEYEKKFPPTRRRYVSDYVKFMLCLINSPKDVEVLRRSEIIENWMGNDKLIFNALEDLGSRVDISRSFTYSGVMKQVNQYCRHRRNLWIAKLKRNYFNSPWSLISFIAAVMLLLLTVIQAVYSVLSYHYKK